MNIFRSQLRKKVPKLTMMTSSMNNSIPAKIPNTKNKSNPKLNSSIANAIGDCFAIEI